MGLGCVRLHFPKYLVHPWLWWSLDKGGMRGGVGVPYGRAFCFQVEFEGKKQSLFDLLEDLNAAECLAKAQSIAGVSGPGYCWNLLAILTYSFY